MDVLIKCVCSDLKVVSVWFQNKRRPTTINREPVTPPIRSPKEENISDPGRRVFANVGTNTPILSAPAQFKSIKSSVTVAIPPASDPVFACSPPKYLWDFLPSSSPASSITEEQAQAGGTYRPRTETEDESSVSPTAEEKGSRSLEWACEHDGRVKSAKKNAKKRLRMRSLTSYISDAYGSSTADLKSSRRKRHRTDARPSKPNLQLQLGTFEESVKMRRLSYAGPGITSYFELEDVEEDVMDVAVALVELKSRGQKKSFPRGRKSV
jgi:hypothetical protein